MMQVILAGSLAFDVLDRLTGEWSVVDQPWARDWIVDPLINRAGVWFALNMTLWCVIALSLVKFMNYLGELSGNVQTLRMKPNLRINVDMLVSFLARKAVSEEGSERDTSGSVIRKVTWTEDPTSEPKWGGSPPKM